MGGGWDAAKAAGNVAVCNAGQIKGGRRSASRYPELHDGPGVGTEAGHGRGCAAGRGLIRVARVVVVARVKRRHRRGRVVIENDGLTGKLRRSQR